MNKRTWTCKDASGCEFVASVLIDSDYYNADIQQTVKGDRRYSAFNGTVKATSLDELKAKVAVF